MNSLRSLTPFSSPPLLLSCLLALSQVYCDASIAFPLIVSQTFAKDFSRSVSDIAKGLRVKQDHEAGAHDRLCAMEDARRAAEIVEAERIAMIKARAAQAEGGGASASAASGGASALSADL